MNDNRAAARAAGKRAAKRAVLVVISAVGVAVAMTLLWFLTSGMHDVAGLLRRLGFTVLFLPAPVFIVAFIDAVGSEKKRGAF